MYSKNKKIRYSINHVTRGILSSELEVIVTYILIFFFLKISIKLNKRIVGIVHEKLKVSEKIVLRIMHLNSNIRTTNMG